MTNPNSPSTTRVIVSNDGGYTSTIKIRAFTEEKNAVLTWNIRVCGEETLTLVDATKKFYIFGHETGSTSGMADSTRYHTIPQSTFETWFNLGPSGDPCVINSYELLLTVTPLVAWPNSDTKVTMTGSIGFYNLRLDKTVPVNGLTFYLRAVTRGLVVIQQEI